VKAVLFFAFPLAAQTTPRRSAGASLLHDLDASVEDLTARVSMSVVQVLVTGYGAVDERASGGETGLVIGRQRRELSRHAAGDSVTLALLRGTAAMSVNITVRERPHPVDELAGLADPEKSAIAKLGIIGIDVGDATGRHMDM